MIFVIDTSALIRIYIPDGPLPDLIEGALHGAEHGNDVLLAPELILAEAGQVLHKKRTQALLTAEEMDEILGLILSLPIRLSSHGDLLKPSCELAHTHRLTVYDALFLALAQRHSAKVISGDDKLLRAAGKMGL